MLSLIIFHFDSDADVYVPAECSESSARPLILHQKVTFSLSNNDGTGISRALVIYAADWAISAKTVSTGYGDERWGLSSP